LAPKKGYEITVKAKRQSFIQWQGRHNNSLKKSGCRVVKLLAREAVASMLESSMQLLLKQIAMPSYTK
jgi:hypothetical protein